MACRPQAKEALSMKVQHPHWKKFTTLCDALIFMALKGNNTLMAEVGQTNDLQPCPPNMPQCLDKKCEF